MKNIATIDTGTTNTRVTLWSGTKFIAEASRGTGVRDVAVSGSKTGLVQAIRACLDELLAAHSDVDETQLLLLGSGMLTADVGLAEIPHLTAPVGLDELAKGMRQVRVPELGVGPLWLIPGIKTVPQNPRNIFQVDVMRGEETEAVAALTQANVVGPALLLLPGSHTKLIQVDAHRQIVASATSMTGELLALLTKESLLTDSLSGEFADHLEPAQLLAGSRAAEKSGLANAAFQVRLLQQFEHLTKNQRANYLLGAVLYEDLSALAGAPSLMLIDNEPILILGKTILREALNLLLLADYRFSNPIIELDYDHLAGSGAIMIAQRRGLLAEKEVVTQ
jgi:2-dehydro-3-deoxygalactonokinase